MGGVEAGVLGGLFMMAWLATVSLLQGRSIWSMPNLLASTFYGEAALRRGFRWTSLSGVALHVIVSAMAGVPAGLAGGGVAHSGRGQLLGLGGGVDWDFLSGGSFLSDANPLVALFSRRGGALLAHTR